KLTALRRLNLLGARVTDASADVLASFKELRDLNLYRSRITNAGVAKLQTLPHLKILDLRYSAVTNAGVEAFRGARPDCKVLFVSSTAPVEFTKGMQQPKANTVTGIAAWIEALGGKVEIANGGIKAISLSEVPFTDAQMEYLKDLSTLEKLSLRGTDISDLGLRVVSRLTALRELDLSFTSVSDRGL